eukprot:sb/3463137/
MLPGAKLEASKRANTGWFAGWWGGGKNADQGSGGMAAKFGISPEEKKAISSAIEQSEAAAASQDYPEKYVKLKVKLDVDQVSFKLNDNVNCIAEAAVKGISSEIGLIPHGNGVAISYQVQTVYVTGPNESYVMSPTDEKNIMPIMDGKVVVNPSDVPEDVSIRTTFSSVTLMGDFVNRLKSQGKSGLLYAIEKRTVMNVNVTLCAPKIILPENGNLALGGPLIVADLGRLVLTTEVGETRSPTELLAMSLAELEETAYDNYLLSLENFHVKMFRDKKLPKIKCKGHLDAVKVRMSDLKIQNLFKILDSIPKPESLTTSQVPTRASVVAFDDDWIDVDGLAAVTQFVSETIERANKNKKRRKKGGSSKSSKTDSDSVTDKTKTDRSSKKSSKKTDSTLSYFKKDRRTTSQSKEALLSPETAASPVSVASVSSDDFFDAPDHFVSEEDSLAEKVAAKINDSSSPYFESDFNKTEMMIMGTFDKLSAKLHIDSFLNLYEFGMSLLPKEGESEGEEEKKKSEGAKTSDVVLREKSVVSTTSDSDVIKVKYRELGSYRELGGYQGLIGLHRFGSNIIKTVKGLLLSGQCSDHSSRVNALTDLITIVYDPCRLR